MTDRNASATETRNYNLHGALALKVVGSNPVADILDKTLQTFKNTDTNTDLTFVLGQYPSQDWTPTGSVVGDRFLYDFQTNQTTIFGDRIKLTLAKKDIEYVIRGDVTNPDQEVTVYVPRIHSLETYLGRIKHELTRRRWTNAVLAATGDPYHPFQGIEHQAERISEAILEPFLFYRLPSKGVSLVHAAVVSSGDSGIMFTGSADIGKTTLALYMAKKGFSYFSDELAILEEDGHLLPYPGLIRLQTQHLVAFPELIDTVAAKLSSFQATIFRRELRHSTEADLNLVPQFSIGELFKDVKIGKRCTLEKIVLIRRGVTKEPVLEEIDHDTMLGVLGAELFWEIELAPWRNSQFAYSPICARGGDFIQAAAQHHVRTANIIRKGISNARCFRLMLPLGYDVQKIDGLLNSVVPEASRGVDG
jgi:hypothetical protein